MATQQTPSRLLGLVQNPCDCQYCTYIDMFAVFCVVCGKFQNVPDPRGHHPLGSMAARARKNIKSLTFYNF